MTKQTGKAKEISLGEDCGDVVLKVNGTRVEVSADGNVLAFTDGSVSAYKNGHITVCPVASDDISASRTIGDRMPDGTVYAGVSPETNQSMYATPADASLSMTFNEAQKYAAKLDAHGHKDWRVPRKAELNVLFNNRAAIGGFNVTGSNPAGWYCSATPDGKWNGWGQRFSDGQQSLIDKDYPSSVRLVRSDARRGMRGEETIVLRMRAVHPKAT
jgi:hypothetical protein